MKYARDVVHADLEHIRAALRDEWPNLAGRRILMTGGAGFLGYYMVQALTHFNRDAAPSDRIHLAVWDNLARGMPDWLGEIVSRDEVSFHKYDLRFPLPKPMPDFDFILHGASIASPTFYRAHPVETMDGNVNGLRNLLDHALARQRAERPIQGLLFWSSSEIYGDPDPANIPTPETYRGNVSCNGPRACYDEAKRYGETLCWVFARHHGVATKIARPFNNYGPGLKINDGRVIPDFARAALAGQDIVMLSDGSPRRTFCYVADAVAGYYKVLVRGGAGEAYNIGIESPEITMRELAQRVAALAAEHFDYKGKVVVQPSTEKDYLVDNPNRRCPVIAKARDQVGYQPAISLDDGLRRTLLWYGDHRAETPESWVPAEGPAA
jgi:UDP-glucuronate decarboxylase